MSSYAAADRPAASHYSRYDDDLDSEEEEEERLLSEQHGEAYDSEDAAGPKRKRGSRTQANATLTEEDAAAAKEFEETVRAKKALRPSLQPSDLKSPGGLLFVRRSFPSQLARYRQASSSSLPSKVRGAGIKSNELARKMNVASQINAAARYSRSLMGAYRDWARELAPSLAAEDALLKIEDLGSKREVKDYLQLMRDEFRKEYLTGIYGEEKAGRILNELEHGLRTQRPAEDDYYGTAGGGGERASVAPRMGFAVSNDEADFEGDVSDTPLSSPPATVAAVANPYTSTNKYGVTASSAETSFPAQAAEDNDGFSPRVDVDTRAEVGGEEEDEESEATFSVNGENEINVTNADISSEFLAGEWAMEDDAASTAAPTAEGDNGTEASALEAIDNTESGNGPKTQENKMNISAEDQQGDLDEINENTSDDMKLNANDDNDIDGGNLPNRSEFLTVDGKTQETLTLMESQLDNYDEYSQDERFSQISEKLAGEAPTQIPCTQDDRFSQTQDDRFSHEDNTADERFSQVTQGMFEVDAEDSKGDAGDEGGNNPCLELGQTY
ncbi:hypothetical protein ACHAW5_006732 [Stephanodiscus triporus]|uniref:Chromosome segregation in meiosis protein 3 domain-containing protein n=1 Tax=Stephanodiscus triporus TaxID=2934178 RepID=A0ABD3P5R2_9STRA